MIRLVQKVHAWYWRRRCLKVIPGATLEHGQYASTIQVNDKQYAGPLFFGNRDGNVWRAAALIAESQGFMAEEVKAMMQTMDARVWARVFVAHVKRNPKIALDEETMVGWFANAIMTGYDRKGEKRAACYMPY